MQSNDSSSSGGKYASLLLKLTIAGAIFTILAGTGLHFLYDAVSSPLIALISPVNESVWEHLKLLFYPLMLFSLVEYFVYGKYYASFFTVKFISSLIGMLLIVMLHYTYVGIFGSSAVPVDIAIFVLSTIAAYFFAYKALSRGVEFRSSTRLLCFMFFLALTLCFSIYTFNPPELPLFIPPEE